MFKILLSIIMSALFALNSASVIKPKSNNKACGRRTAIVRYWDAVNAQNWEEWKYTIAPCEWKHLFMFCFAPLENMFLL